MESQNVNCCGRGKQKYNMMWQTQDTTTYVLSSRSLAISSRIGWTTATTASAVWRFKSAWLARSRLRATCSEEHETLPAASFDAKHEHGTRGSVRTSCGSRCVADARMDTRLDTAGRDWGSNVIPEVESVTARLILELMLWMKTIRMSMSDSWR